MNPWIYVYFGGAVLTFAFGLGSLILGMQRGDASVEWRTEEGRVEVLLSLFHGLFANAMVWPLSLVLSARKAVQMVQAGEPFEFSICEDRALRYPPRERFDADLVKLYQSLPFALDDICIPAGVEGLSVAAVLLELAWHQIDCEAHEQGVSTKVARGEMGAHGAARRTGTRHLLPGPEPLRTRDRAGAASAERSEWAGMRVGGAAPPRERLGKPLLRGVPGALASARLGADPAYTRRTLGSPIEVCGAAW